MCLLHTLNNGPNDSLSNLNDAKLTFLMNPFLIAGNRGTCKKTSKNANKKTESQKFQNAKQKEKSNET